MDSQKKSAGFSLVEIALSLAVISIGFVAILGLLPTSLDVFRSSMNLSISTQIAQRLLNDAQQTEFSVLTGGTTPLAYHELPMRYFDEEGNELPEEKANESIFEARTVVESNPKFPDARGENNIVMDELASVVVQVATNPGRRPLAKDGLTLLWLPDRNVQIETYTVLVAHHD